MSLSDESRERFYTTLAQVPAGKDITYGQLADQAGQPRRARLAGRILKELPSDSRLPWHRIVNAQGNLSFPKGSPAYLKQRTLLESEGVVFSAAGKIDLKRLGWI